MLFWAVAVYAFNPNTPEAEAGGSLAVFKVSLSTGVPGQPQIHRKPCLKNHHPSSPPHTHTHKKHCFCIPRTESQRQEWVGTQGKEERVRDVFLTNPQWSSYQ